MRDMAVLPKLVSGAEPGSTILTAMLNGSSSNASDSVKAFTAALLAV